MSRRYDALIHTISLMPFFVADAAATLISLRYAAAAFDA